jgi:HSP20 family protein
MAHNWDPIRDLMVLQDRMNRLFEDATQRRGRGEDEGEIEGADWSPAADVYEHENEYVIALDLPGIDRAALDISIDRERLVIRGVRVIEEQGGHRVERPRGRFLRRFGMPSTVDQQGIKAEYKDGVLRVYLPKQKEQKPRRVEIKIQ